MHFTITFETNEISGKYYPKFPTFSQFFQKYFYPLVLRNLRFETGTDKAANYIIFNKLALLQLHPALYSDTKKIQLYLVSLVKNWVSAKEGRERDTHTKREIYSEKKREKERGRAEEIQRNMIRKTDTERESVCVLEWERVWGRERERARKLNRIFVK